MKKVLIADDEPDMADFLKAALEAEGYAVESAASADAIHAKVKAENPDLILLDMGMPGLDERKPAEAVKRKTRTRAKILLVTGRDVEAERKKGGLAGADGALTKGAGMDQIVAKVKALLG